MTTIDRLGLIGIRSYGTDEETFIKFYKPLTIILGRNGSGKTTIVEAVKMATTGDPPTFVDKGAAFIHDPRIHNETETKAKIRLLFTNVRGDQYVVSRHFQLSLKKGPRGIGYKTEFKTLDQTIKRMDGGAASSYRCSDLNALLPDIMRVTKPVLNNVIFVHQEDSLWPLGDSKKLKEKFDEIFAATRYTKALDTIRKFRKDQSAELKTVNVELNHYEYKVQVLDKIRTEVDEIRVRHDELRQGLDALNNEISDLTAERNAADVVAKEYEEKCVKLNELQTKADMIEEAKNEKYRDMENPLPNVDDNALATEIDELKKFLERAERECLDRTKLIRDLKADIEMKRTELHTRLSRKGSLEEMVKRQSERIISLDVMKEELLRNNAFTNPEAMPSEAISLPARPASLQSWSEALNALHKEAEEHAISVSTSCDKKMDGASFNVNRAEVCLQDAKSALKRKEMEVCNKRNKISGIRNKLDALRSSQTSIKEAESKLKAVDRIWKDKSASTHIQDLEKEISSGKKEISCCREDLELLRNIRDQLVKKQNEHSRYDNCREAERKKKIYLEGVVEDFREVLLSAINEFGDVDDSSLSQLQRSVTCQTNVTPANPENQKKNLLDISDDILVRKDSMVQEAERLHNDSAASLQSASRRRAELKDECGDIKKELQSRRSEIRDTKSSIAGIPKTSVDLDDVTKLLEECQVSSGAAPIRLRREHLNTIQRKLAAVENAVVRSNQKISQLESGVLLAEDDLAAFEDDPRHRCPACGLTSSKKVEEMRRNLKSRVEYLKDPESARIEEEQLVNLGNSSRALKQVQSIGIEALTQLTSFETNKSKFDEADRAFRKCKENVAETEGVVKNLQNRFGSGSGMNQIALKRLELKQAYADWERVVREVADAKASLADTTEESRSLSDTNDEIREIEEHLHKLQDDNEKKFRALDRENHELNDLNNRRNLATQGFLKLQSTAEQIKRLQNDKEELSNAASVIESEADALRGSFKSLKQQREYAEEEFHTVRAENGEALKKANEVLMKRKMALQKWDDCRIKVEAFNQSGKAQDLEKLLSSLKTIEADIASRRMDLDGHENEQRTASNSQAVMKATIRNLEDNQAFRIQERKLQANARSARQVQDEISALERKAGGDPSQKVISIADMINSKNETRSATVAKKQQLTESYKEKKKELVKAEKEGSRRKFDECRIRKQTMELASSDLEKYHRALDQALMAFHTLKMNSINRTIRELWQQTYRGTDIDEIEVTSDHGDPRAGTGGALKRTFNYRVQMRQGQATLDMRGRCSAGQKVLACLVIRLALAESFCTDCGILALDEPTTNLDRENIESLAAALRTIIESRRKQRNFQLVLITHDQDFIDTIGARDFCNEYFLIYKDMQGVSRARVQALQEM